MSENANVSQEGVIWNKAISTYLGSELRRQDEEERREVANILRQFLQLFGIEQEVNDHYVEVEGLLIYSVDDISGVRLIEASRKCQDCGEVLASPSIMFLPGAEAEKVIAEFGKWLHQPHFCEPKNTRRAGFRSL